MAKKVKVKKKCCHKYQKKGKQCKACPEDVQEKCRKKSEKKKKKKKK